MESILLFFFRGSGDLTQMAKTDRSWDWEPSNRQDKFSRKVVKSYRIRPVRLGRFSTRETFSPTLNLFRFLLCRIRFVVNHPWISFQRSKSRRSKSIQSEVSWTYQGSSCSYLVHHMRRKKQDFWERASKVPYMKPKECCKGGCQFFDPTWLGWFLLFTVYSVTFFCRLFIYHATSVEGSKRHMFPSCLRRYTNPCCIRWHDDAKKMDIPLVGSLDKTCWNGKYIDLVIYMYYVHFNICLNKYMWTNTPYIFIYIYLYRYFSIYIFMWNLSRYILECIHIINKLFWVKIPPFLVWGGAKSISASWPISGRHQRCWWCTIGMACIRRRLEDVPTGPWISGNL